MLVDINHIIMVRLLHYTIDNFDIKCIFIWRILIKMVNDNINNNNAIPMTHISLKNNAHYARKQSEIRRRSCLQRLPRIQ